jgi:hypothetical protein
MPRNLCVARDLRLPPETETEHYLIDTDLELVIHHPDNMDAYIRTDKWEPLEGKQ